MVHANANVTSNEQKNQEAVLSFVMNRELPESLQNFADSVTIVASANPED